MGGGGGRAVARPDPGSGWPFAKWFSRPKPCPKNITRQPRRKGLQTRWVSAGTGWSVRPPERQAWGGGACVWGANRRCCLQSQLFGVFGSWPQRNPGSGSLGLHLFPSFSKQPLRTVAIITLLHSIARHPPCVSQEGAKQRHILFFCFLRSRGFPPPQLKKNLFLHQDRLPTGYKLYQEYWAITRIQDPGFLCRAGLMCFKEESSSPIQLPISSTNSLPFCPTVHNESWWASPR